MGFVAAVGRVFIAFLTGAVYDIDHSGNPFVDQLINGRAEGPIQMEIGKP